MTNTDTGNRLFGPRLMEIGNKSTNFKSGRIELELIDTGFNLDGRYGTISPASKIDSGSDTSILRLKKSFGTNELDEETEKWEKYIGEKLRVRSNDLAYDEIVTFESIHPTISNAIVVTPSLPSAPLEDYIVEPPTYPNASKLWKAAHCFSDPSVNVTAGVSTIQFTVDAGDIGKFQIGAFIRVHNDDFTQDSGDTTILNIIGNDIITEDDLGFTPSSANQVQLIGFASDGGKPYRIL